MTMLLRVSALLFAALLFLSACNESASDKINTRDLVLRGVLTVDGSQARLRVELAKEGSFVVVVLQGSDSLHAGDGVTEERMDYVSDVFGSYYRSSFPLVDGATYTTTLYRAADESFVSTFPPVPVAFALTAPTSGQTFSLASTPVTTLKWDTLIGSDALTASVGLTCAWTVTAGVPSDVNRVSSHSWALSDAQAALRQVDINLGSLVADQEADVQTANPGATVELVSCDAGLGLEAENLGDANPALSGDSGMSSIRARSRSIQLVP